MAKKLKKSGACKETVRQRFRMPFVPPIICFILASIAEGYGFCCLFVGGPRLSGLFIWFLGALLLRLIAILLLLVSDLQERVGIHPKNRRKRIMRIVAKSGIVLLGLCFLSVEGLVVSGMRETGEKDLDYIIVLGAKVNGDKPGIALETRINAAAEYLNQNPRTIAVLSGGQGSDESMTEAMCMYRYLTEMGIDGDRLILEERSTSTAENLLYSYALIPEDARVGVLTNNFHVFRAKCIGKKLGEREISGIAAPYPSLLLPHYMMREFFTITADFLKGNL